MGTEEDVYIGESRPERPGRLALKGEPSEDASYLVQVQCRSSCGCLDKKDQLK